MSGSDNDSNVFTDDLAAALARAREAPSPEARIHITDNVASLYTDGRLTNAGRAIACEIFDALARDIDARVRHSLSEQLCNSPLLPPDLARRLASDIDSVATPVLRHAQVLTDHDLLAIIEAASQTKLLAISKREKLSAEVSDALVEHGDESVTISLLNNPGANLTATSLRKALDRHPDSSRVHEALVDRPRLPAQLVVRLVERIKDDLIDRLFERHGLPSQWKHDIGELTESATMTDLVHRPDDIAEVAALVDGLHARGKLSTFVLLRALILREGAFVFHGFAKLAGHGVADVRRCLLDEGMFEQRKLYSASGLPPQLFPAFNAGLSAFRDDLQDGGRKTDSGYQRDVVARLVRSCPDIAPGSVDNILAQLESKLAHAGGRGDDAHGAARI